MTDIAASQRHGTGVWTALCRAGAVMLLAGSIGACSTIGNLFSGEDDDAPPPKSTASDAKSGDTSTPKLSTVPDRPKTQTNPAQRQAIAQGLRGDKENAKYAGDVTPVDESGDAKLGQRLPGSPDASKANAPAGPGQVSTAPVTPAAAAPAPAGAPLPAPVSVGGFVGRGSTLEVAVIQFGKGSADLSGEDRAILREVAAMHRRNGGSIRVIGHDGDDGATTNIQAKVAAMGVSQARANAVAAELMRNGVRRDAIQTSAVSDGSAAMPGTLLAAADRKAEIFLDF